MRRPHTDTDHTDEGGGKILRPKKSLGQNFLTAPGIAAFIAEAATKAGSDTILEIGPGKGVLTRELLSRAKKVVAVEKDDELVSYLSKEFSNEIAAGTLELIGGDALVDTPEKLGLLPYSFSVAANIPYYITGEIMRMLLSGGTQPSSMTLLVQKEVAERIVAKDGKESILSISVKVYGAPHYLKTVKAGAFYPAPKVDSAVLQISNITKDVFTEVSEEQFFTVIKAGFAHKRKQLAGSLGSVFGKEKVSEALAAASLSPTIRPENLSVSDWLRLTGSLL